MAWGNVARHRLRVMVLRWQTPRRKRRNFGAFSLNVYGAQAGLSGCPQRVRPIQAASWLPGRPLTAGSEIQ